MMLARIVPASRTAMMYASRAAFPNQLGFGSGPSSAIHIAIPNARKLACWRP